MSESANRPSLWTRADKVVTAVWAFVMVLIAVLPVFGPTGRHPTCWVGAARWRSSASLLFAQFWRGATFARRSNFGALRPPMQFSLYSFNSGD